VVRPLAAATGSAACVFALLATAPVQASASITLHAYAKRADAVCADYHRKAAELPRVRLSDFPGLVKLASDTLVIVAADNKRLRAIPLPQAKRDLVVRWLHRGYRVPKLLRALSHAAKKKSVTAVLAANRALQDNGAKRRSLAHRLGMKTCSQP
jgi:hypothetical protein